MGGKRDLFEARKETNVVGAQVRREGNIMFVFYLFIYF